MPVAGKEYTKDVDLITPEAKVTLIMNPKSSVWDDLPEGTGSGNAMLAVLIKKWNFTNEAGEILPITPENIPLCLSNFDIVRIQQELGLDKLVLADTKKKS